MISVTRAHISEAPSVWFGVQFQTNEDATRMPRRQRKQKKVFATGVRSVNFACRIKNLVLKGGLPFWQSFTKPPL
ncbi:hypothetical protein [Bremerella cremea]|uniref:hypothetical protein n=1 Tax=Bremerella cremea TaxID=1031537 RepID=UPI0011C031D8|nr:hypothetical protein [Bremerella cremea]